MAGITKTAIANVTLGELGEKFLTNVETDQSPVASKVRHMWDFARDYALALHQWNFAVSRVANVPSLGSSPSWEYDYAYAHPTNSLRILQLGQGRRPVDVPWAVELDNATDTLVLVTSLSAPIDIKFIKRVENTELYSPLFCIALAKCLKIFLARPLTGKPEVKAEAENELRTFMQQAMSVDGLEGTYEPYGPTDLEDVR